MNEPKASIYLADLTHTTVTISNDSFPLNIGYINAYLLKYYKNLKIKLFKCFLDAAVSEQVARMVAMKSATENANDMIKMLSRTYNRARQSQITGEIMEVIGGVEALEG